MRSYNTLSTTNRIRLGLAASTLVLAGCGGTAKEQELAATADAMPTPAQTKLDCWRQANTPAIAVPDFIAGKLRSDNPAITQEEINKGSVVILDCDQTMNVSMFNQPTPIAVIPQGIAKKCIVVGINDSNTPRPSNKFNSILAFCPIPAEGQRIDIDPDSSAGSTV
jgi:hypothetical protein